MTDNLKWDYEIRPLSSFQSVQKWVKCHI